MKKKITLLIISFLISLPLWWILNDFQGSYTAQVSQINWQNKKAQVLPTNLEDNSEKKEKYSYERLKNFDVRAKSALSVRLEGNHEVILYEKNPDRPLPIASLTKLMTSLVALEVYNPSQLLYISKEAVDQEENFGNLKVGERLSVNNLIHIALMESSNDAAFALAQGIYSPDKTFGKENFVTLMNKEAHYIGLKNTYFFNPTGLDGENYVNYSTANDLARLIIYIIKKKPEILEISNKNYYIVLTPEGKIHHIISQNRNELVGEIPGLVGGKTGYTEEAGGCIITVFKNESGDYLINVILGSENSKARFIETKRLLKALEENNLW